MSDIVVQRSGDIVEYAEREPSLARTAWTGMAVILLAFGGLGSWGVLAELDSAASAPGAVSVESSRKTVQHLEGGIVVAIDVKEGESVTRGQTLLRLSDIQAGASLAQAEEQFLISKARIARLRAEQAGADVVQFPADVFTKARQPLAGRIMKDQVDLFETRRRAHLADLEVLRQQAKQASRQAETFRVRERSSAEQLGSVEEELKGIRELYEKGLERKPRLMQAIRSAAYLSGQRDEARSEAERAAQALSLAEAQVEAREQTRAAEIAADLDAANAKLAEDIAHLNTFRDEAVRTAVRAPIDGVVMNLKVHTVGGVVKPGEPIMEVVPYREGLIIEARVRPVDVDTVRPGLPARLRLTAYKQRRTPIVEGTVETVSADRLTDEKSGEHYFIARIRPKDREIERLDGIRLYPGMPVDVLILTGRRRAIDYVLEPLTDTISRAMIEE